MRGIASPVVLAASSSRGNSVVTAPAPPSHRRPIGVAWSGHPGGGATVEAAAHRPLMFIRGAWLASWSWESSAVGQKGGTA